jgi:hypothetical protein
MNQEIRQNGKKMPHLNKKQCVFLLVTLVAVIFMICIGPLDVFTHGFYTDTLDTTQILEDDFGSHVRLINSDYEMQFSPKKAHMVGFELYLKNQPEGNTGTLELTILQQEKEMDHISIDLSKVTESKWYKVYANAKLKEGEVYTLRFSAKQCDTVPCLQNVEKSYLPEETMSGSILLGYAYAQSTFTFQNKIIIGLFVLALWMLLISWYLTPKKSGGGYCKTVGIGLFLIAVLTWNYMYNSMDVSNTSFASFQADSETLVTGMIYAEQDDVYFKDTNEVGYGLGRYYNTAGSWYSYGLTYLSDDNWQNGYSKQGAALLLNSNIYTQEVLQVGNYVEFKNGSRFRMEAVEYTDTYIKVSLNAEEILTFEKYGSILDAKFYNQNGEALKQSRITAYKSQYGLQGKVFRHFARYMKEENIVLNLNLFCSLMTAMVFVLIVFVIARKYNFLMAGIFYLVFWLSPWVVIFARNLYWVEFTWFLPMLIGLVCAWKLEERRWRVACYIATFIAIWGKSLCGYEYISTIMMGMISFLLVDGVVAIVEKNPTKFKLIFRSIFVLGIIAIIGFFAAICLHATLRGEGDMFEGIKKIFEQDVLRRTVGADLNGYSELYRDSFNASMWDVYRRYFKLSTEVLTGIPANLFPSLCIIPLVTFIYEYKHKHRRLNYELLSMYLVFFITSISWFCLAKGHSYIHTHMNYVMWYFGFVQICLYIIVNAIVQAYKRLECEREDSDKDKGLVVPGIKNR